MTSSPRLHHAADIAISRPTSTPSSQRQALQAPDGGRSQDHTHKPYDRPRDGTPHTGGRQFLQSVYIRARPTPSTGSSNTGPSSSASFFSSVHAGTSSSAGPSCASDAGMYDLNSGHYDATGLAPVREFLRALHPEQSSLLPVLVKKGVRTGADLDCLACMPRERRKRLLILWLLEETITQLQFEALDAGFEALVS